MDKTKVLEKYLPPDAAPLISRWIDYFKCEFKISRSRNSKFGDYRPPFQGKGHRISVNHNLNPYAFLVTTVHEFAHLHTWNQHQHKVRPHGNEWKLNFKAMMQPFFEKNVFPPDITHAITAYLNNPGASSCSDLNLYRTLRAYDVVKESVTTVEKLPLNVLFKLKDGRVFRKGEQLRKRFRCTEVSTKRIYLFSPVAEVEWIKD
ncbi:SprT family zinc-dependent metalloprotease [Mucilaginibacter robiniae]|uniref:SprT family zinc-dependent metalloprotease n=1 Tax=Mucilaginibacter robiniae TaxID=2728022 RepID=A0A7L5E7X6_9SPHI|nr:SprT-like domain-containing protein [Mucilaginibacter robiniae]QJD96466.1 SprT family zinc-dependent metalloprotease [Mucilaginibacter robiniae]